MQTRLGRGLRQTPTRFVAATFVVALLLAAIIWSQSSVNPDPEKIEPSVAGAGPLDGLQFLARIVRDDADENGENGALGDQLAFSDGKFSSAICRRYNFADAPYWVRTEGGEVHFLAELTSPTDGRMVWKGTIRGDTLEGTMRWTKQRWYWTIDAEHKIRGKLETPPGAAARPSD